jgi:glycosyltransferase involved in cell wall biosynthesis
MPRRRVDQLLAGFAEGDAVSIDALLLQAAFRSLDFDSDIYVSDGYAAPEMLAACRPASAYAGRNGDSLLFHYSVASSATEVFLRTPARRLVRYHNITPPEYFRGFDDAIAARLAEGRHRLAEVVRAASAVWPVSEFNAGDIRPLGAEHIDVLPLLFSPRRFDVAPAPDVLARLREPLDTLLFVGRGAPNKRIEDLLQAFACYQRLFNPFSRLVLVGSDRNCPRYYAMLRRLALDLNLPNACFEGYATEAGLAAYYRKADLFVSASMHEGYCLPLVEAMAHGVPVIARATGGVPEAMGNAGVLYDDLSPSELAALIDRVLTDKTLRRDIVGSQENRVTELAGRDAAAEVHALLPP